MASGGYSAPAMPIHLTAADLIDLRCIGPEPCEVISACTPPSF